MDSDEGRGYAARSLNCAAIRKALGQRGPMTVRQLSASTGLSEAVVRRWVETLAVRGQVHREHLGRQRRYRLAPDTETRDQTDE